jgi:hypothetical protein
MPDFPKFSGVRTRCPKCATLTEQVTTFLGWPTWDDDDYAPLSAKADEL